MRVETPKVFERAGDIANHYFAMNELLDIAVMGANFKDNLSNPKFDLPTLIGEGQALMGRAVIDIATFNGANQIRGIDYDQSEAGMLLLVRVGQYFKKHHPEIDPEKVHLYISDAFSAFTNLDFHELDVDILEVFSKTYGELADVERRRAYKVY